MLVREPNRSRDRSAARRSVSVRLSRRARARDSQDSNLLFRNHGSRFEEALAFFEARDEPLTDARTRIKSIVIVQVERALPMTSPAYDLGLSEHEVVERWLAYFDSIWPVQGRRHALALDRPTDG